MSTKFKIVSAFVLGDIVGALITFGIVKRYYQKKSIEIINNAISSINDDSFAKKSDISEDQVTSQEKKEAFPIESFKEEDMVAYHKIIGKYTSDKPSLDSLNFRKKTDNEELEEQMSDEELEALREKVHGIVNEGKTDKENYIENPPYIISKSEYTERGGIYDKVLFIYFPDKGILLDEDNYKVDCEVVGLENLKLLTDGEQAVYVRNEECGIEIEIEKAHLTYDQYIGGLEIPQDD